MIQVNDICKVIDDNSRPWKGMTVKVLYIYKSGTDAIVKNVDGSSEYDCKLSSLKKLDAK